MAGGLYFENFAKIITEAKIGISLAYFKTTSYFWCIVPLKSGNTLKDLLAKELIWNSDFGGKSVFLRLILFLV